MKSASLSTKESNNIRHRFITPSQEGEIDKAGRIAIPQTLRDHARLSKDCLILGVGTSIEIWDAEQYQAYQNSIEANLDDVLDKMSSADLFG
jgi:MraZ protein